MIFIISKSSFEFLVLKDLINSKDKIADISINKKICELHKNTFLNFKIPGGRGDHSVIKINDKRVVFTGYVNNPNVLAELYHNCYAYLHGHEYGGTNPTMIKAMAYGCAILALDTVFNKEMLQNGKFGIFFKKELFSIINMIEYCERENIIMDNLRQKSIEGITKKYNWDYVSGQYSEIFNSLISKRN